MGRGALVGDFGWAGGMTEITCNSIKNNFTLIILLKSLLLQMVKKHNSLQHISILFTVAKHQFCDFQFMNKFILFQIYILRCATYLIIHVQLFSSTIISNIHLLFGHLDYSDNIYIYISLSVMIRALSTS